MVALIVVKCVRLDNVVVESERMLVQKVLMLVCFVVVNSSTGQANRLLASRGCMVGAHVNLQCGHDLKSKLFNS